MKLWSLRKGKTPLLHYVLMMYWLVLLIWQNMGAGGTDNKSIVDVVIKMLLITLLCVYYLMHATGIRRDILLTIMTLVALYVYTKITSLNDSSAVLYYFFPLMFLLLIYGCGWKFELRRYQLVKMCSMLVLVVAYIAVYALIFCFDQFQNAFTITSAYGNELKSFLMSSHEYGLYLAFGIMAAILCIELDPSCTKAKKAWYIVAIVLFAVNLILTFSRTSLLAMALMMICYVLLFAKKKLRNWMFVLLAVLVLTVLFVTPLREFFWEIVMKENTEAGRDTLRGMAIQLFDLGAARQKLFGWEYGLVRGMLSGSQNLGSFHNAYLQQLVANGIVGAAILVSVSVVTLADIYKTIRRGTQWSRVPKIFIAFNCASLAFMIFNTTCLFASSIDSYFLTLFVAIIPKYVNRSIREGTFDIPKKKEVRRHSVSRIHHR